MKAVIIDDEAPCREALIWDLSEYHPDIEVCGEAANGRDGLEVIRAQQPDVVFLDIEMPVMNGLQMLKELGGSAPHVIFTTAYDEFAIKAFRLNAVDYLLKPIEPDELEEALLRCREGKTSRKGLEHLSGSLTDRSHKMVSFSVSDGVEFVEIENIMYCKASSNYSEVFIKGGRKLLLSKTLKQVDLLLDLPGFLRIHKSALINIQYIQKYIRGDGGYALMKDGEELPVARTRRDLLLKHFSSFDT